MTEEDPAFEKFVRTALEGGPAVGDATLRKIGEIAAHEAKARRSRRRWLGFGASFSVAASLVGALVFAVMLSDGRMGDEGGVKDAIGLLCELDGVSEPESEGLTAAELLLAWQDAPCQDIM